VDDLHDLLAGLQALQHVADRWRACAPVDEVRAPLAARTFGFEERLANLAQTLADVLFPSAGSGRRRRRRTPSSFW
jgi:hypothetical protein